MKCRLHLFGVYALGKTYIAIEVRFCFSTEDGKKSITRLHENRHIKSVGLLRFLRSREESVSYNRE